MKKKYVQPACYAVEMEGVDTLCNISVEKPGSGSFPVSTSSDSQTAESAWDSYSVTDDK